MRFLHAFALAPLSVLPMQAAWAQSAVSEAVADIPWSSYLNYALGAFTGVKATDVVIAVCVLVLAWYAARLSRYTDRMWRVAANQAREIKEAIEIGKRNADAAEEHARATRDSIEVAAEAASATREAARVIWETAGVVTRDSAERQLRAYVFVTSGVIALANGDTGVIVTVDFENSGQTPGHDFTTWARVQVADAHADPFGPAPLPEQWPGPTVVPPRGRIQVSGSHPLTSDELQAIRGRSKAVFVWGGCDYKDTFGNPRQFIFRSAVTGPEMTGSSGGQAWRGWTLRPHKAGYEST